MVEGESKEIQEAELVEAIKFAHTAIKLQCLAQKELTIEVGKTEKRVYSHEHSNEDLKKAIYAATYDQVYAIASAASAKEERGAKFKEVRDAYIATLGEIDDITKGLAKKYYHDVEYDAIRNLVLDEGKRLDGRTTTQIRPIWSEVGYLPSAHGSAVFTRGETQSLTTVTLGAKDDEQMIDGAFINGYQKFLLHYNFPGFSTGEVRPNRGAGRREIGHGNLAMRSLKQVLPSEDENPYTIRIVSDILESNGSSSMATVCAGTLALMDAGVKIKEPVSGIAMGLITNEMGTKYAILSDILGDEDHLGDMDFKVTGTKNGIVAVQMDLKINGLSYEVLTNALNQAKDGRLHILGEMAKTITNHTLRVLLPLKLIKNLLVQLSGPVVKSSRKCSVKQAQPFLSKKKTTRVLFRSLPITRLLSMLL
jgi:polyribonucleotide nucleotidyltransferase